MTSPRNFLCLACVGLVAAMCLLCPPANAQLNDTQQKLINEKLDLIASLFSQQLADSPVRELVWVETQSARNKEQKLDLKETVEAANAGLRDETWGNIEQVMKDVDRAIWGALRDDEATQFDLYFPVDAHRQKWDGGSDLLIASLPVDDNDMAGGIIAYSVKDGSVVKLDPNVPPDTPTLIIGLREAEPDEPAPPMVELPGDANVPGEVNPVVPKGTDMNSYIGIPWLKILKDHEPWYKGDPEVYVKVTQKPRGVDVTQTIDLPRVNDEDKWYNLGDGPGYPLYFFYDAATYDPVTCFEFRESDWPDGDDFMGFACVDRDQITPWGFIPWGDYMVVEADDVLFLVDKDP